MTINKQPEEFLAIDPGNTKTGWFRFRDNPDSEFGLDVGGFGIDSNEDVRARIRSQAWAPRRTRLLIETPKPRGMPTSGEEMETLIHIGRFIQEWSRMGGRYSFVFRGDVKLHLCNSTRAKDGNVNQAIRDHFGGDQKPVKCPGCKGKGWRGLGRPVCDDCKGRKFETLPGPIFGATSHVYPAIGVGLWWLEFREVQQRIINPGGRDPRAEKQSKPVQRPRKKKRTSRTLG